MKQGSLIYKIVTILTLGLPLPIYMFLSATLFNLTPDYQIKNVMIEELTVISEVVEEETYTYLVTDNIEVVFEGMVVYIQSHDKYGLRVDEEDIIKVDGNYYSCLLNKDTQAYELTDIKRFAIQETQRAKLPLAFFISVLAVLIVALVVQGKMKWHKKYPRIAVFIALLTGTVILYLIDTIVGSMLSVFMVATVSWGAYLLEYLVAQNKIKGETADKIENELTTALKNALKGGN